MYTSSDDFSLVNDCVNGKREAWDFFVQRFSKLIYHAINKALKSYACNLPQEDIEDIYNGVFLSFIENDFKKIRQFKGKMGCSLSSWVRLITIRHTIDFLRVQRQHSSLDDINAATGSMTEALHDKNPSVQEHLELSETEKIMKECIEDLPPSDRLFMALYYEKELPPEKIADVINVSVNTIYSKKKRIREKLEKILKNKWFNARNAT